MIKQQARRLLCRGCRSATRVLRKIAKIIEEEQDRSGAIELLMPTLQSADLWRESGRYDGLRQGDAAHRGPARARTALWSDK